MKGHGPVVPPDRVLFGQYLIEHKKVDEETLKKALAIQMKESHAIMRDSHRYLGQILFEDFEVFKDRIELNRWVTNFHKYKTEIETMIAEAKGVKYSKK
jgi:hypothetical protein